MMFAPRTALPPIPEECSGKPHREGPQARSEPSNTDCSEATTDDSCGSTDDEGAERAERAAKRAAVERAATRRRPARRSVNAWPADRAVSLRMSADPDAKSMLAVCRIREGVLTLSIEERAAAGAKTEVVVAEVPVEGLAMRLHRGRADMFTLAAVNENEVLDEIYCFCGGPATRLEWIEDFLRVGIAIFDLRD